MRGDKKDADKEKKKKKKKNYKASKHTSNKGRIEREKVCVVCKKREREQPSFERGMHTLGNVGALAGQARPDFDKDKKKERLKV